MDPSDFLVVAQNLYSSASEADQRTSVSRSYYALYNLLHVALSNVGVSLSRNAEDHALVVYYLTNCRPPAPAAGVALALNSLRTERNSADYDMRAMVDNRKSEFAYKKALDSCEKFKSLDQRALNNLAQCITFLGPPPRLTNRR